LGDEEGRGVVPIRKKTAVSLGQKAAARTGGDEIAGGRGNAGQAANSVSIIAMRFGSAAKKETWPERDRALVPHLGHSCRVRGIGEDFCAETAAHGSSGG